MGQRKYPPLTPREITDILISRGFSLSHSKGDHNFYVHTVKGQKCIAQVDMGNPSYKDVWLKLVIRESGMTREQFYCSTKSAAKKIGLECAEDEELISWSLSES